MFNTGSLFGIATLGSTIYASYKNSTYFKCLIISIIIFILMVIIMFIFADDFGEIIGSFIGISILGFIITVIMFGSWYYTSRDFIKYIKSDIKIENVGDTSSSSLKIK